VRRSRSAGRARLVRVSFKLGDCPTDVGSCRRSCAGWLRPIGGGVDPTVLVDSVEEAATLAADRASMAGIPALIEVDCDGHRGGVQP
jgi:hypothetical protein